MNFKQLCTDLIKVADLKKAKSMEKALGGRFRFMGLDAETRRTHLQPYLDEEEPIEPIDWEFVEICWDQLFREFQYIALSYLLYRRDSLEPSDIKHFKTLAFQNAWWDTGNMLQKLMNYFTARYPELEDEMVNWAKADDPWLNRCALLHQLGRGKHTRIDILEKALKECSRSKDRYVLSAMYRSVEDCEEDFPEFVAEMRKKYPQLAKKKKKAK